MPICLQGYRVEETSTEWTLHHNDFSLCTRKIGINLENIK